MHVYVKVHNLFVVIVCGRQCFSSHLFLIMLNPVYQLIIASVCFVWSQTLGPCIPSEDTADTL